MRKTPKMEENWIRKAVKMLDLGIEDIMKPIGNTKTDEEAIQLLQ